MKSTYITPIALAILCASDSFVQAQHPILNDADGRAKIENAIPTQALVTPAKPRHLLIFDLNVGYGGHGSIAFANYAFKIMGEKTGAWATTISRDPAVFEQKSLKQFDAVFFNNNVGNLFTNSDWRENLAEFVHSGGGLMGVHGSTVAFTQWPGAVEDWPEFGIMIGARGANHKDSDERVRIKLDDPKNPITSCFGGKGFEYRDEFFRPQEPYSRKQSRILLSMDTEKFDPNQGQARGNCFRADNDYAVAWIRGYGRGRVFYCTIAHNPYVFWDPTLLKFYQGAIQYVLGDLAVSDTPSARLTPGVQAREKRGWRLGLAANRKTTLFESIDLAGKLGLSYVGGQAGQQVSQTITKKFAPDLLAEDLRQIRLKLNSAGIRLLSLHVDSIPESASEKRKLFEFSRKMGVEILVSSKPSAVSDAVAGLSGEFGIPLASSNSETARYLELDGNDEKLPLRLQGVKPAMIGIRCDTAETIPQAAKTIERVDQIAAERANVVDK